MKHPALARMLGVFLAVISVLSILAGGLALVRAGSDYKEEQRQIEVLAGKVARAEELRAGSEELRPAYDAIMKDYPTQMADYHSSASDYRMKLAAYSAARAGIRMGRSQLDDTAAMLDESMEMFLTGFLLFKQGEDAFRPIYEICLSVRGTLDAGLGIYEEAAARLPDVETGEVVFTPEEVLSLAALGHEGYGELTELLTELRDQTPPDQHQAAELIRTALETYGEAAAELDDLSVERLAYSASLALYERAEAYMDEQIAAGMSEEEARAAADRLCEASFGVSFEELGRLIAESEPEEGTGETGTAALPPEMAELLLGQLPDDGTLIDGAIALLADADASLSEKEAAFRADPHDMSAAELLLESAGEGLDSADRLLGLVEPTIRETWQTLQSTHEQLDAAWYAIYSAQQQVKEGYEALEEKLKELHTELRGLLSARGKLKDRQSSLDALTTQVEAFEDATARFRSLRSELLGEDEIYERVQAGSDFLSAAKLTLALRRSEAPQTYRLRLTACLLVIAAGLFGFVSALGAFERPRIRRLWIPLLAASLLAAAGEAISLYQGRGLWYTALFVVVFALAVLPLCPGKKNAAV